MSDQDNGIFLNSPEGKIPADDMIYLLPIEAVLNILNGDDVCSVIPFCCNGKQGVDITDANCYASPWKRTNHQPLCLLAQLWIMWGFVRKGTQK
jgi:hypothetical protein